MTGGAEADEPPPPSAEAGVTCVILPPHGESVRSHRVGCFDELRFDEKGLIQPVVVTKTGVPADTIR